MKATANVCERHGKSLLTPWQKVVKAEVNFRAEVTRETLGTRFGPNIQNGGRR